MKLAASLAFISLTRAAAQAYWRTARGILEEELSSFKARIEEIDAIERRLNLTSQEAS